MKFKELNEIDAIVANLYKVRPTLQNGKFGYAYTKFYKKNILPVREELQEKISDINLEFALTDSKTKELIYEGQGEQKTYKYTKEDMKKKIEKTRKILKEFEEKEIKIEQFITKDIPEGLSDYEKEMLKGVII